MERKKKKENGGFYIAVCCCVVIIAIVGYANRLPKEENNPQEKIVQKAEIVDEAKDEQETLPKANEEKAETNQEENEEPVAANKNVEVEEKINFRLPVDGKVIEEYSGDDLVYNEALKDWRAHSGVDFEAKTGETVKVSAKGIVLEVFDSSLGRCVVIDHKNGFTTMYANLDEDTPVKAGDEVAEGDTIGKVGNTALGDSTEEPHLHFEMMKQGENVNPTEYLE